MNLILELKENKKQLQVWPILMNWTQTFDWKKIISETETKSFSNLIFYLGVNSITS